LLRYLKYIWLLLMLSNAYGQISPGDLSNAHANLEGMSNCTKCHDLGAKVSNIKCLDCHKEIQTLVNQKRGYHANPTVTSKDCFACHSEHHGRKFDMIHFDENKFDHNLAYYKLEGKHAVVDCRKCHAPENIQSAELKKRGDTFLGLEKACLSCPDDYHQKTLSNDCAKCHNMEAFKPAANFDHNKTDYKLTGKHTEVDCKECHKLTTLNGKEFQQLADVAYNDCKACHDDPHNKHFTNKCSQCHTTNSFTEFIGAKTFDHSATNFPLKGKHKTTDCFECHKTTTDPLTIFQDRLGVAVNVCATCHKDAHNGKFGSNCAKCHDEKSFVAVKSMDSFDHNLTDYPLKGKHVNVDCKKCHKESYTKAIDFSACQKCHKDYHNGEFKKNGVSPDCRECHSLSEGFGVSLYTMEKHQASKFPLEGAHVATPCFACHVNEEKKWTFRNIGSTCYDCHDNVHGNTFAVAGVTDCKRCHVPDDWFPSKFAHDKTAFPLEGKHAEVECVACHKTYVENGKTLVKYKIEKFDCIDCHQ